MKFRELCAKEIVQLSNGACLGRADDLELDPATAQVKSLLLLGRPHLFGLLGRDETLTIPWADIERTLLSPPDESPVFPGKSHSHQGRYGGTGP